MKKFSTDELRRMFLDYFEGQGHMIEPGASLVPINDPTLLWINSGVAALKKYFDGSVIPANRRICNAQKSIRTNDIDNVGKTARHHTFFEMLGNFSIGDYFKKEAINFAWEFLTSPNWIGMPVDKMYVSVHTNDDEAYDIWVNDIGLDQKRILKTDGNFWEIGEGPSGPNSEIFYDRGVDFDPENVGEKLFFEEIDNDRYLEVWNVVFSQYDAKEGISRDQYLELPQKNIDTGMGLERLACIVQDVETNFDIDVFQGIIKEIEKEAKHKYQGQYRESYQIISDHIRSIVFALSDGAAFANEGRGYVLRRLLRRAVRHGKKLGIEHSYLYKLAAVVAKVMEDYYPYLHEKTEYNQKLILSEEERFSKTLNEGEELLNEELKKARDKLLSGSVAFKLYDTFGFPIELTMEMATEAGYDVDLDGFKAEMDQQKQRAREARVSGDSMHAQSADLLAYDIPSAFLGYQQLTASAKIIGIFQDGKQVEEGSGQLSVIFDQTPFYAESGGQIGDTGLLVINGEEIEIDDCVKAPNGQNLHKMDTTVAIKNDNEVILAVDMIRRKKIMRNHSSVHLIHAVLREVVGTHITQAGSYVSDQYARLDFTNFAKIEENDINRMELMVNKMIESGVAVDVELMSLADAKNSGAMALFDEKYGDNVRVITMGDYSKELCGGTHVNNIAEIGIFKILSEESVGSGIRRLTFTTASNVYQIFKEQEVKVNNVQSTLGVTQSSQLEMKLNELITENKELQQELQTLNQLKLHTVAEQILSEVQKKDKFDVITHISSEIEGADLKQLADELKNRLSNTLVILASTKHDKVVFVVSCDEQVNSQGIMAGDIAKQLAIATGGNGGGRKDFAQSGGKDVSKVKEAVDLLVTNY